jgi:hypothetical protein
MAKLSENLAALALAGEMNLTGAYQNRVLKKDRAGSKRR